MFEPTTAFSGFSVNDLAKAKDFYVNTLGLEIMSEQMGLTLGLPGGGSVFVYEKEDHQPATFTHLNFAVNNIDQALEELSGRGVTFERYDLGNGAEQDEKGILRGLTYNMGPDIAWFKDPSGNTLAILQNS